MQIQEGYRVAVVGATGMVGTTVLDRLIDRQFPTSEIVPYASPASLGQRLSSHELVVASLSHEAIEGFDLAFMCTDDVTSREWAPLFAAAGAAVIDKTSEWRRTKPLVVPEVNPEALDNFEDIVSSPNCATIQAVVAVKPILDAVGIERLKINTFQAVSGSGIRGRTELETQTCDALVNTPFQGCLEPTVYPQQIAFNVLPQVGNPVDGSDLFDEEEKIVYETRNILQLGCRWLGASCTRVPVRNAHSERIEFTPAEPFSIERCQSLLMSAPGVELVLPYPTAIGADGQDKVQVGLIREDMTQEGGYEMWVVADNLRKGAGTNAVQIAELMVRKGII